MEENITIQGKKYISARRVSKKSGYNSDYLGQLCRAGKLECRFLSRTWFIEEESLVEHLKNGRKRTSPLLSEINSGGVGRQVPENNIKEVNLSGDLGNSSYPILAVKNRKFLKTKVFVNTFLIVFVITSVSLLAFDINNTFIKDRNSFVKENVDGFQNRVSYVSGDNAGAFLPELFDSFKYFKNKLKNKLSSLLFRSEKKLTLDNYSENETEVEEILSQEKRGLISIPLSGSEDDVSVEDWKEHIKASFSDEVLIFPDNSNTSGIIRPVFRETSNEEYLYVMVPLVGG